MEGKRKEHNQIPAAEFSSIRLDGAVPRAKGWRGNWARAKVGFTGRDDGPCVGMYRWGRGVSAFLRVHEWDCYVFGVCAKWTEWHNPSSPLAHWSPVRIEGSDWLTIQWRDDSQFWGWELCWPSTYTQPLGNCVAAADNRVLPSQAKKHTTLHQAVVSWFHMPEPVRITSEAPCGGVEGGGVEDGSLFLSITTSVPLTSFYFGTWHCQSWWHSSILKMSPTTDCWKV